MSGVNNKKLDEQLIRVVINQNGDEEVRIRKVKYLLYLGANKDVFIDRKYNLLMKAVDNDDVAMVKVLLDKGANIEAVNWDGESALILAIKRKNNEIVSELLDKGADVNSRKWDGNPVIMAAVVYDNPWAVEKLVQKGADVDAVGNIFFNATPLFWAVERGNLEVVKALIKAGANVNYRDEKSGDSVLLLGAFGGREKIVFELLQNGADVNAKTNWGRDALYWAIKRTNKNIIKMLLDKGAKVSDKHILMLEGLKDKEVAGMILNKKNKDCYVGKVLNKELGR